MGCVQSCKTVMVVTKSGGEESGGALRLRRAPPNRRRRVRIWRKPNNICWGPPMPDRQSHVWPQELFLQHQDHDQDLHEVRQWLQEDPTTRPRWEDIAENRASLKYWWHRYECLELDGDLGIVQIRWIDPLGEPRWRKIVPATITTVA